MGAGFENYKRRNKRTSTKIQEIRYKYKNLTHGKEDNMGEETDATKNIHLTTGINDSDDLSMETSSSRDQNNINSSDSDSECSDEPYTDNDKSKKRKPI